MTNRLISGDEDPTPDPLEFSHVDGSVSRRRLLAGALSAGGAVVLSGASASLLAACGGSSSDASAELTAEQVKNAKGTVHVIGWQSYDQPAEHAGAVKAKWTYATSAPEMVTKVRPPGSFDIVVSSAFQMGEYLALNRVAPIDTNLLVNYKSIAPVFRDNETWKGPDGKIYGVPLLDSAILTAYLAHKVPRPTSADDLLRPEYKKGIGLVDDSTQTIPHIARILGKQGDPARITEAEFDGVKKYLDKLRPQVRTIYGSGEEPSLLQRGDLNLALTAYTFIFPTKIPDLATTMLGSLGWVDSLSILKDADQAAAHNWIDKAISLPVQRQLAGKGPYQPARLDANDAMPPVMQTAPFSPFEDMIKNSPMITRVPVKAESGVVGLEDWASAWNDYKANFG
jgi:spermidine/putrescine-binding protein